MSGCSSSRPFAAPRGVLFAWTALWVALAVMHVTQAIWLSGFTARPGDLEDGRFNRLVLEHGYQALRGVYPWTSPGMYFPTQHTLGYSDTHAGTLLFYAALRFAGASSVRAWQGWFIVVALLNALAVLRLFRVLGVPCATQGPLVFAATASAVMVRLAGSHMQMLPLFPGVLACAALVSWQRERRPATLLAAVGWFAWQFAATPYGAVFCAVVFGSAAFIVSLRSPAVTTASPPLSAWREWTRAGMVAGLGALLAGAALIAYARAPEHTRSYAEMVELAPTWRAWCSAPTVHLLYRNGWPGGLTQSDAWFNGFFPWLGLGLAAVTGWRTRRGTTGRWLLGLVAGTLFALLLFTQWTPRFGPWTSLAAHFEWPRAIRATGRVAVWIQLAQVSAIALWLATRPPRAWRIVAAVALATEGLAWHQSSASLALESARADAIVRAWRTHGDRPVLAFVPGFTNQSLVLLHLDAWDAALRLGRTTLNGYSSDAPGSHLAFWWTPTPESARALMASTGVDIDSVSLVEHLDPADAAALNLRQFSSRPLEHFDDSDLQPATWTLSSPLERYEFAGRPMYQLTPPAEVRFTLPDDASVFEFSFAMRAGAYQADAHTDGVGVTVTLARGSEPEQPLWREHLDPIGNLAHRGLIAARIPLPPGHHRTVILRTDFGPAGDGQYDWPLFGHFRSQ